MSQAAPLAAHPMTRRDVLAMAAAASIAPRAFAAETPRPSRSAGDELQIALLGAGWRPDIRRHGRGIALGKQAQSIGRLVALAEVDRVAGDYAAERFADASGPPLDRVTDYRDLLGREDIDAVIVATPDHWHAKMAVDALRAGKHVYLEKPATVTVAEGRDLIREAERAGRTLLVGTQQRTEIGRRFAQAIALVRSGRLGQIRTIRVGVDPGLDGGPFPTQPIPERLDYELWQGPAPERPYCPERTHWTFRWWVEYAGGKLTDWGAHHVDIAQWAIGRLHTGPTRIEGEGTLPQPFENGFPTRDDTYAMPLTFSVRCLFPELPNAERLGGDTATAGEVTMTIDSGENGILFEGTAGRIFVNRGRLTGAPVEEMASDPLPESAVEAVYRDLGYDGPLPVSHMRHFADCIRDRRQPISDIATHHRTLTTCHLANLSLRLGRPLQWDPQRERFADDPAADALLHRDPRPGYAYGE